MHLTANKARRFVDRLFAKIARAEPIGAFPEVQVLALHALRTATRVAQDESGEILIESPEYGPILIWIHHLPRTRVVSSLDSEILPNFVVVHTL